MTESTVRQLAQHPLKVWTRDAIIDAIQRWADEHGQPPSSNDWPRANRALGYPGRFSVYRRPNGAPHAPFASWNEAIAAAGFTPRPHVRKQEKDPKLVARWRVGREVRLGRIVREPCEVCGSEAQAHHDDYAKPLDVRWLCQRHHNEVHGRSKETAA